MKKGYFYSILLFLLVVACWYLGGRALVLLGVEPFPEPRACLWEFPYDNFTDQTDAEECCSNSLVLNFRKLRFRPDEVKENERIVLGLLRQYMDWREQGNGKAGEEQKVLVKVLGGCAEVIRGIKDLTEHDLPLYKYSLRYLCRRLEALSPGTVRSQKYYPLNDAGSSFVESYIVRFSAIDEHIYRVLYERRGQKHIPFCPDSQEDLGYWSLQAFVALRSRDEALLEKLEKQSGYIYSQDWNNGQKTEWPLEVYRQMSSFMWYDGGFYERGEKQVDDFVSLLPPKYLVGKTWFELGYGLGVIFSPLHQKIGERGLIIGKELESSCICFAKMLDKELANNPSLAWGRIQYVEGSFNSIDAPEHSVDIIHGNGVYMLAQCEEKVKPYLANCRRALKPGGLLLIDDASSPSMEQVRSLMRRAHFRELNLQGGRMVFAWWYRSTPLRHPTAWFLTGDQYTQERAVFQMIP